MPRRIADLHFGEDDSAGLSVYQRDVGALRAKGISGPTVELPSLLARSSGSLRRSARQPLVTWTTWRGCRRRTRQGIWPTLGVHRGLAGLKVKAARRATSGVNRSIIGAGEVAFGGWAHQARDPRRGLYYSRALATERAVTVKIAAQADPPVVEFVASTPSPSFETITEFRARGSVSAISRMRG